MPVTIKSSHQISLMRQAGLLLSKVHSELKKEVRPGITTGKLDSIGETIIRDLGCTPNFKGYNGFPGAICASLNDTVIHGIPDEKTVLKEGDIISLDLGLEYKGYHSDAARTWPVGQVSEDAERLIKVTENCFFQGVSKIREGSDLADIGKRIEYCAVIEGYGVVRDFCGHGIGSGLHEDPDVYNFYVPDNKLTLISGMTLAIEPMINAGSGRVTVSDDGWTVKTMDNSLSAHYENTVLVTEDGYEILTLMEEEKGI